MYSIESAIEPAEGAARRCARLLSHQSHGTDSLNLNLNLNLFRVKRRELRTRSARKLASPPSRKMNPFRRRRGTAEAKAYLAMSDDRTQPLVARQGPATGNPFDAPPAAEGPAKSSKKPGLLSRTLSASVASVSLSRRKPRPAVMPGGGMNDHRQWAAERQTLLDDCTAVRAEAAAFEHALEGYSAMMRDLLHYSVFHGKSAQLKQFFADRLRESVGEIEGVHDVEITELRLPSSSDCAPQLSLVQYGGPEMSEWRVKWEPPSSRVGAAISLRGRKFGVSFTIMLNVTGFKVSGAIKAKWTAGSASPTLELGFIQLPKLTFDVIAVGKALSLGSDTLRAWLVRQTEKAVNAHLVLPKVFVLELPLFQGAAEASTPTPTTMPTSPPGAGVHSVTTMAAAEFFLI